MALIVASIDFGTTFSGWAYSLKADFERNPLCVTTKHWSGGDKISEKGPTCALIEPDGQTLHSFGFDAENKYSQLAGDEKHGSWYYFWRFKMLLFDKIGIDRNIEIVDVSGRRLPARRLFRLSIEYLKDDLIKTIERALTGELTKNVICWVLTVPAIWNDAAKQFMREAAVHVGGISCSFHMVRVKTRLYAGIPDAKLSIVLEPECASLYCLHMPVEICAGGSDPSLASFKAGTKYLVLDAGGSTWIRTSADLSSLQVTDRFPT